MRAIACGAPAKATSWSSSARRCSIWSCVSRCRRCSNAAARTSLPGIIELTPGIRSLQVHFDPARSPNVAFSTGRWARSHACRSWINAIAEPHRAPAAVLGRSGRRSSPPSVHAIGARRCALVSDNIEFIRRINGLESIDEVRDIVFGASYLVMGLGDVYLGAPVATPLDPRHRLVTTKYNPARTWTPENAVGIGGAYLCVYGMEGPGGYQFVGRTVQMWNRYRQTGGFPRWQAVAAAILRPDPLLSGERRRAAGMRAGFPYGRYPLRIEESQLDLAEYLALPRGRAALHRGVSPQTTCCVRRRT